MGPAFEDPGLSGLTMEDYADDVLALMTHLEMEHAAVGGLSMGGYVAFAMLRRAPERVEGLVLSNTRAIADSAQAREARAASIDLAEREGAAGIAREMGPKLLGETTRRGQPDLEEAVKRLILVNAPDAIMAALNALRSRPDSTNLLPSIAVPTLVIAGDEDAIVNISESRSMQQAIPGATLVTLARTGHLGNLEAPGPWSSAVDTFLAGL
jgi:3-oxoadipate enol-lactonase